MRNDVTEHLRASFQRYGDLVESLSEEALAGRLPVPSNTIGTQIWWLIGARQSYTLALQKRPVVGGSLGAAAVCVSSPPANPPSAA